MHLVVETYFSLPYGNAAMRPSTCLKTFYFIELQTREVRAFFQRLPQERTKLMGLFSQEAAARGK
jgi:hypothetical protein